MKKLIYVLLSTLCFPVFADYKETSNLQISQISAWGSSGDILIQTNPKHSIDSLGCTSNYWLKLRKIDDGYQAMLSMLMAAQIAKTSVLVRAIDDSGTDFCRLERVISYQ